MNLLWQFRNSMLHAFADPGGFDIGNRVEPYYVGDIATHTWRLKRTCSPTAPAVMWRRWQKRKSSVQSREGF
ncbi:MAG TPA: hypothetical protein VEU11_03475 [Terriglobales bacterium]|nr:hypothetical protein [Terriglobales bacterium]